MAMGTGKLRAATNRVRYILEHPNFPARPLLTAPPRVVLTPRLSKKLSPNLIATPNPTTGRRRRITRARSGLNSSASSRTRMPGPTPPSRPPSRPQGELAARASAPASTADARAPRGTRRSSTPPRRSSRWRGSTRRRRDRMGIPRGREGSAPSAAAAGTSPRSARTSTRC